MNRNEKTIKKLKMAMLKQKPFLPGSISTQWNVCGKQGCKCKDPIEPVKHGPYYQLSFTVNGKSSSMFIKKEDLAEAKIRINRYAHFKKIVADLISSHILLVREHGMREQ